MPIKSTLKKAIDPSTERKVRSVYKATRDLFRHLILKAKHRSALAKRCRGRTGLKLNIGCGALHRDDWVNIDYVAGENVFFHDAVDAFPIADGSVQHIHCEHFLEHLDFADGVALLKECHRMLQASGTVRIIVPDAERYMQAYVKNDTEFFDKLVDLGGATIPLKPKNMVCNQAFRMDGGHLFGWDFETLESVCQKIGFVATRSSLNDAAPHLVIDGQDWWRPHESLYANLRKVC